VERNTDLSGNVGSSGMLNESYPTRFHVPTLDAVQSFSGIIMMHPAKPDAQYGVLAVSFLRYSFASAINIPCNIYLQGPLACVLGTWDLQCRSIKLCFWEI
jgi:hypothetical protein